VQTFLLSSFAPWAFVIHMRVITYTAAFLISVAITSTLALADDWPQFRGPHRDGSWDETGALEKFPAEGIKIEWKRRPK
jgi:hypothetical protein